MSVRLLQGGQLVLCIFLYLYIYVYFLDFTSLRENKNSANLSLKVSLKGIQAVVQKRGAKVVAPALGKFLGNELILAIDISLTSIVVSLFQRNHSNSTIRVCKL